MSNQEAIANLEIIALPDDFKCAKCKFVLKKACQVPCGCRFCRTCIDDVISMGDQFCPGGSQECGATPLSTALPDYRANKSVLELIAKCPHAGCSHQCPLADMESHVHACSSKNIDCPFRELGCVQGALPGVEMSCHLLQESRGHSEILIGTVAKISRDVEMLKTELLLKDEHYRHLENEMKLIIDENKSIKDENKSIKDENKSIKDEMKSIKIENKSIKIVNKSIKVKCNLIDLEKEMLCDRVRELSEKLEREIDGRRQSDERDIAIVTAVTGAVSSSETTLNTKMKPIKDDIQSIKDQFDFMKRQVESIQVAVGLEQLDDWLIEEDVTKTGWGWFGSGKSSGKFGGQGLALTYELSSWNSVSGGDLRIYLRIWAGPRDSLLEWPFRGTVTVTVSHKNWRGACSRQTQQCRIKRPADNEYSESELFQFTHDTLMRAGLNLKLGLRISCRIVPGAGQ